MKAWFWSQLIVAAVLLVYGVLAVVYFLEPDRFWFPISNVIGLFGLPLFGLGLIVSLVVNQLILKARPRRVVTTRESVVLGVEFGLIAASLAVLLMEDWFVEIMIVWFLTTVAAIVACVVISTTSAQLRAASGVAAGEDELAEDRLAEG